MMKLHRIKLYVLSMVCMSIYAQDISLLNEKAFVQEYHGDGAVVVGNQQGSDVENDKVISHASPPIEPNEWVKRYLPSIMSTDYVNYEAHDALVAELFNTSGKKMYMEWQRRHVPILLKHRYIVKAVTMDPIDILSQPSGLYSLSVPMRLTYMGYGMHHAKKVETANVTVKLKLESKGNQWAVSQMSVDVNDNQKRN